MARTSGSRRRESSAVPSHSPFTSMLSISPRRPIGYNPRFPGQLYDAETGLNDNVNRIYNSMVGSYIQHDPSGLAGHQFSLYPYVAANPLSEVDPFALQAIPPQIIDEILEDLPVIVQEIKGAASLVTTAIEGEAVAVQEEATLAPQECEIPSDIQQTLNRIQAQESLPFANDATTFQNREGLLPLQEPGYYTEYVHPTPGAFGPGAQRVIVGNNGEIYYTPDHYKTFLQIP